MLKSSHYLFIRNLLFLLVLYLVYIAIFSTIVEANETSNKTVVGDVANITVLRNIRLDNAGNPLIVMFDKKIMKYKYFQIINGKIVNDLLSPELLIENKTKLPFNSFSSIIYDKNNIPFILINGSRSVNYANELVLVTKKDHKWVYRTVDYNSMITSYNSLCISKRGDLAFIYIKKLPNLKEKLIYATLKNDKITKHSILNGRDGQLDNATLTLDSYNQPHVCFTNRIENELVYMNIQRLRWVSETISTEASIHCYSTIVIDKSGCPLVVFNDRRYMKLQIAKKLDNKWNIISISDLAPGVVCTYIDKNFNTIHILYGEAVWGSIVIDHYNFVDYKLHSLNNKSEKSILFESKEPILNYSVVYRYSNSKTKYNLLYNIEGFHEIYYQELEK